MAIKTFAVVVIADVQHLVNATGAAVITNARHSVDGAKIILDLNHHQTTINSLFVEGVDANTLLAGCQILSHQQAIDLMATVEWNSGEVI